MAQIFKIVRINGDHCKLTRAFTGLREIRRLQETAIRAHGGGMYTGALYMHLLL